MEKRVSKMIRMNSAWLLTAAAVLAGVAHAGSEATDASKTVVVVSSDNPKISGQLFHPKICPNLVATRRFSVQNIQNSVGRRIYFAPQKRLRNRYTRRSRQKCCGWS